MTLQHLVSQDAAPSSVAAFYLKEIESAIAYRQKDLDTFTASIRAAEQDIERLETLRAQWLYTEREAQSIERIYGDIATRFGFSGLLTVAAHLNGQKEAHHD